MNIAYLDLETRSKCDLKARGAHRYASDPSTEIMMAGVAGVDGEVFLWVNPKFEFDTALGFAGVKSDPRALELLRKADLVYVHSVQFEQALIWAKGLPSVRIRIDQWRCTAAMGRKAGLPSSLEKLGAALNLGLQKDTKGKALIRHFCIPRKDGQFNEPREHPAKWKQFCDYCKTDVAVERTIHGKLSAFELSGGALDTFLFDLRMNQLGIPVNREALTNAQWIINQVQERTTTEFQALTGVLPTQRARVLALVQELGVAVDNLQADTLAEVTPTLPEGSKERRILELYSELSFAAIKKVDTMLDWCCADGRMRGVFKYYGSGTGRWSAGGPQIQNVKKPAPHLRKLTKPAYHAIASGATVEDLEMIYGDPLEIIASCIRHFVHAPGQEMLDGDYNAVESRIACWRAGQMDALEEYRQGIDRYKTMAAEIFGKPASQITDDERQLGKCAVLGLGYGMGAEKFKATCLTMYGLTISDELAEKAKQAFRRKHNRVQVYWYMLDEQARDAIAQPGRKFGDFVVRTIAGIQFLLVTLPSGRALAYPHPKIETPAGEDRDQITYWGQIPMSTQWGRIKLYGAKIFENEVQAIAADVMAHGALTAEKRGMMPFALIHDQGLALRQNGKTAAEFAAALGELPPWAKGLPLKVEAKVTEFYSK